jgi:hypothetical protein
MTMMNWKSVRIACATLALGLLMATSGHAVSMRHENQLTFTRPVALPGVVLPAGAYSFDLVDSRSSLDLVIVRDRAQTKVFYMGFTNLVRRPNGMSTSAPVAFAEAPANQPRPIAVWFEIGDSIGHQFLYQ